MRRNIPFVVDREECRSAIQNSPHASICDACTWEGESLKNVTLIEVKGYTAYNSPAWRLPFNL